MIGKTLPAVAVSAVLLLTGGLSYSQSSDSTVSLYGVGQMPCQNFLAAERERDDAYYDYTQWTWGLLTALNIDGVASGKSAMDKVSPEERTEYLVNFCDSFPSERFYIAAFGLAKSLGYETDYAD